MTTVTIAMRDPVTGKRGIDRAVQGDVVGPFAIHKGTFISLGKWTVSHVATGYAVAHAPTKASAIHAAKRLQELDADWSFTDPRTVKSWSKDVFAQVHIIRTAASEGGKA